MRKKIWPLMSSLAIISTPLLAISCSTTWINWKRGDDVETDFDFKEDEIKEESQYEVREKAVLMEAYDQAQKIIDLNKIYNHYEFIELIKIISNVKINAPIDTFWEEKSWTNFHNQNNQGFFDLMVPKLSFRLKSGNDIGGLIEYNLEDVLKTIISGFDDFEKDGRIHAFPVEYVDASGIAQPFDKIASVGMPLTKLEIVKSLLNFKSQFAMSLSKLVNLPKKSFDNFVNLLKELDQWTRVIYDDSLFKHWIKSKNVNFKIDTDGIEDKKGLSDIMLFQAKYVFHILS